MKKLFFVRKTDIQYPVGTNLEAAIEYINVIVESLKHHNLITDDNIIVLWVRGSSGAILGALFAKSVTNQVIIQHVKKPGEDSHESGLGKIYSDKAINIVLDDFTVSGATIQAIYQKVYERDIKIDILIIEHYLNKTDFTGIESEYLLISEDMGNQNKTINLQ